MDEERRKAALYRAASDLRDAVQAGDADAVDRAIETLQRLSPPDALRTGRWPSPGNSKL
jgi:hypothetical protein